MTPEDLAATSERSRKKRDAVDAAHAWVAALRPYAEVLSFNGSDLDLVLWVEPEPQVRQTANSGRYNPMAIKYNGWKHACAEAVKAALRVSLIVETCPLLDPGCQYAVLAAFHVSVPRRVYEVDLDNYLKAALDMLNTCGRVWDPEAYPSATPGLKVWKDDSSVFQIEAHKEWEPDPGRSRIGLSIGPIETRVPPRPSKRLPAPKPEHWIVSEDAQGFRRETGPFTTLAELETAFRAVKAGFLDTKHRVQGSLAGRKLLISNSPSGRMPEMFPIQVWVERTPAAPAPKESP